MVCIKSRGGGRRGGKVGLRAGHGGSALLACKHHATSPDISSPCRAACLPIPRNTGSGQQRAGCQQSCSSPAACRCPAVWMGLVGTCGRGRGGLLPCARPAHRCLSCTAKRSLADAGIPTTYDTFSNSPETRWRPARRRTSQSGRRCASAPEADGLGRNGKGKGVGWGIACRCRDAGRAAQISKASQAGHP